MATFCKNGSATPIRSEEGLGGTLPSSDFPDSVGCYDGINHEFSQEELKALDAEGRAVITQHRLKVGALFVSQKDGSQQNSLRLLTQIADLTFLYLKDPFRYLCKYSSLYYAVLIFAHLDPNFTGVFDLTSGKNETNLEKTFDFP